MWRLGSIVRYKGMPLVVLCGAGAALAAAGARPWTIVGAQVAAGLAATAASDTAQRWHALEGEADNLADYAASEVARTGVAVYMAMVDRSRWPMMWLEVIAFPDGREMKVHRSWSWRKLKELPAPTWAKNGAKERDELA